MIRMTGGRAITSALLAALLGLTACGNDASGTPEGRSPQTTAASSTAATPDSPAQTSTATPDQASDVSDLPPAFPPLTEEVGTQHYLETMVRIHVLVTKNRQAHEVIPAVVAIKSKADCTFVPNQGGATQKVGDGVSGGVSPEIAACFKDGKLAIFYAPHKFYQLYRNNNVGFIHDVVRNVMRDYLALLTQNKIKDLDRLVTACAAGRMIGGLRDKSYITVQKAGSLELSDPNDQSDWAKIYRAARDTGNCPSRWLGAA